WRVLLQPRSGGAGIRIPRWSDGDVHGSRRPRGIHGREVRGVPRRRHCGRGSARVARHCEQRGGHRAPDRRRQSVLLSHRLRRATIANAWSASPLWAESIGCRPTFGSSSVMTRRSVLAIAAIALGTLVSGAAAHAQASEARYINPPGLSRPTGYTHVVLAADGRTAYIAGQVALDST